MPLYEYQCPKCGRFELIKKFSDAPLTECPTCASPVEKLLSSPAIQFKGTGWYITDYARKSDGKKGDAAKGDGVKTEGAKTEGTKTDGTKTEGAKDSGTSSTSSDGKSSTGSASKDSGSSKT